MAAYGTLKAHWKQHSLVEIEKQAAAAKSRAAGRAAGWYDGVILEQRFQACYEFKEKEVQIVLCCANSSWTCKSMVKFYV